jgi:hypothetical protein
MARPPLFDVAMSHEVSVRLTPAQRLELEAVARAERAPMTDVVRAAVNAYVLDYCDMTIFPPRRRRRC